nr:hypothetical protein CNBHFHNP_00033 [Gallid alphaherpesvirus 2]WOL20943.1 hypothetical protein AIIDPAOG_00032 [Gallid alphaherpesvirus 2]WOL21040.1 hypothetical protein GFCMFDBG_00034 [Gallid alphaherpesvirus 2]WOL21131.1 hypothetical protein HIGPJJAF_00035 [Gallid alphaherpesvirus 2]WOL21226.1 hypothetical protein PIKIBBIB_00034 [Gallid alphaherpesvirus 2]
MTHASADIVMGACDKTMSITREIELHDKVFGRPLLSSLSDSVHVAPQIRATPLTLEWHTRFKYCSCP